MIKFLSKLFSKTFSVDTAANKGQGFLVALMIKADQDDVELVWVDAFRNIKGFAESWQKGFYSMLEKHFSRGSPFEQKMGLRRISMECAENYAMNLKYLEFDDEERDLITKQIFPEGTTQEKVDEMKLCCINNHINILVIRHLQKDFFNDASDLNYLAAYQKILNLIYKHNYENALALQKGEEYLLGRSIFILEERKKEIFKNVLEGKNYLYSPEGDE